MKVTTGKRKDRENLRSMANEKFIVFCWGGDWITVVYSTRLLSLVCHVVHFLSIVSYKLLYYLGGFSKSPTENTYRPPTKVLQ